MTLDQFLAGNQRNAWIVYGPMQMYMRKSRRLFNDPTMIDCIDLANFTIENPADQGKGTFTRFFAELLEKTPLPIYVENLFNERFEQSLVRRGFKPLGGNPPCFLLER
jgi:hypothetical protein